MKRMDEQNENFLKKPEQQISSTENNQPQANADSNNEQHIHYEIKKSADIPVYASQVTKRTVDGKAIASMVLGIVALLLDLTFVLSPVSVILGIVGLVLGIVSNKKSRSGFAIAGIATSAVAIGLGLLEAASCFGCWAMFSNELRNTEMWIDGMEDFNFAPFQPMENPGETLII